MDSSKGYNRWRTGIILKCKADYEYSDGIRRSHGYNIYNIEIYTTVSRTQADIRKYKHTKLERKLLEEAHQFLEEFMKNNRFCSENIAPPPEFEISEGYSTQPKTTPHKPTTSPTPTLEPGTPAQTTQQTQPPDRTPAQETQQEIKPEQTSEPKRILWFTLDGPAWQGTETRGSRLRVRTTGILEELQDEDKDEETGRKNNEQGFI